MPRIVWDEAGKRFYETGVKNGVLYVQDANGAYPLGVPWNGLIGVNESPSGAESTPLYADDIKYLEMMSVEEFGATIEAYTYPDEFGACDGSAEIADGVFAGQQGRKTFGLCYRTIVGNDVAGEALGYKLHFVYGAKAAPSEKSYKTVNNDPEAITFSWTVTTTPVPVPGFKPTACLTFDSRTADPTKLAALEAIIYGDAAAARLPLPTEILTLMAAG